MKKLIYTIIAGSLALSACNSLDENPTSFLTSDQFYETKEDAINSVTGVYAHLSSDVGNGVDFGLYQRQLQLTAEKLSDNEQAGPGATNPNVVGLGNVNIIASNDRVQKTWKQLYAAINRANASIDNIPGIDFSDQPSLENRLIGEAKFLRALFYFELVRLWGDVPLVLHETTSLEGLKVARATTTDVYAQIIDDLTFARTYLPIVAPETGRATKGAATALLAKVYLTQRDWKNAIKYSDELIDPASGYGYSLFPNFGDIFDNAYKNQKEHIFDVQYLSNSSKTNLLGISAAPGGKSATGLAIPGAWDADVPNGAYKAEGVELYNAFNPIDERRDVTYYTSYVQGTDTFDFKIPHYHKFVDPAAGINFTVSGVNFPIIRYADVILISSEAHNEDNGGPNTTAYERVNWIRNRAGLPDLTAGLTVDQFRDSVFLERRFEFVYENQRWYDLIRHGGTYFLDQLHAHGKPNAQAFNVLLPIPQAEIDKDPNLTQNTGY